MTVSLLRWVFLVSLASQHNVPKHLLIFAVHQMAVFTQFTTALTAVVLLQIQPVTFILDFAPFQFPKLLFSRTPYVFGATRGKKNIYKNISNWGYPMTNIKVCLFESLCLIEQYGHMADHTCFLQVKFTEIHIAVICNYKTTYAHLKVKVYLCY